MGTKVAIISLGGTISMGKKEINGGVSPSLTADDLFKLIPEDIIKKRNIFIKPITYKLVPGSALDFVDLINLSNMIKKLLGYEGYDGIIITQGTTTIEETAFFLDLVLDYENPIIVTGAMRNPTLPGYDGIANLIDSILVAANKETWGLGVLVVMGGEIHSARYVQKTHNSRINAFTSYPGILGWIIEDRVSLILKPVKKLPKFKINETMANKKVCMYMTYIGDDGVALEKLASICDGIVLVSFAGGAVPPRVSDIAKRIAVEKPVVFAGRARRGEIPLRTYSFIGSEIDLISGGLIPARSLDPVKARVLLYVLLASGYSKSEIYNIISNWNY
ncbi:MAG: asparaginase [Desulfurococcales archaeon]|jgi:L-asparaginase|nr:asparaginase [Desulfurococcales archaeon]